MLGVELVRGLVATVGLCAAPTSCRRFSLERQQDAAIACAALARRMTKDPRRADAAFTAALLHDIGNVVLAMGMPAELDAMLGTDSCQDTLEREREALGVTHAEVGAYLLGLWGLPHAIVEAAAYHHTPSVVLDGDREILATVHAADVLSTGVGQLDMDFLAQAGCTSELPRWRALATPTGPRAVQELSR